jgi:hypothetical protein
MAARPNVAIITIPGPLTSHTLEPLPLQRAVNAALDAALERALGDARELAGRAPERGLWAPTS